VLLIAAAAVLPVLAMSLLAWRYGALLQPVVPVELSTGHALRRVLATLFSPSDHGDSWLPMRRALEVLSGPERGLLYETLFFRDGVRFQYPPTSLLPLEFLQRIGLGEVRALNALNSAALLANAAAVGWLAWLLFRVPNGAAAGRPDARAMAVLAAGLAMLFYPLLRAHVLGQIQLWIDLAFTLALICWRLDRRMLAGALVGLACAIKPQLGLLVVWALLWREGRFVAGAALALAPIAAVSLVRYGLHNHLEYLQVLSFLSRHGELFFANNSVNGLLNWHLSPGDSRVWLDGAFTPFHPVVYAGSLLASAVFYGFILAAPIIGRRRRPGLADISAAAICTILGAPVAWEHHYGLLAPVFVVALAAAFMTAGARTRGARFFALAAAWALTANFIPFASLFEDTALVGLQAYVMAGALLLLASLQVQPAARAPAEARA
jgi:hypothetical protein